MRNSNLRWSALLALCILFFSFSMAIADPPISVDGNLSDWQGKPSFVDTGGPDDGKDRGDINEYRVASDGSYLYLLGAWDDTSLGNNQSSTGQLTYVLDGIYYRVYFRLQGTQSGIPQASMQSIVRCLDGANCFSTQTLCNAASCGVNLAVSTSWPDPFAGQHVAINPCDGTNPDCYQFDTAIEARIPWGQSGQLPKPGNNNFAFMRFSAEGSSGSKDPASDPTNGDGLACQNTDGALSCYKSTPTAVEMLAFQAKAVTESWITAGALTGALLLMGLLGIILLSRSR